MAVRNGMKVKARNIEELFINLEEQHEEPEPLFRELDELIISAVPALDRSFIQETV